MKSLFFFLLVVMNESRVIAEQTKETVLYKVPLASLFVLEQLGKAEYYGKCFSLRILSK